MEEIIIPIVGIYLTTNSNNETLYDAESSGKDIVMLFKDFIKWKDTNCIYNQETNTYLFWENRFTLEGAFKYWYHNLLA